MYEGDFSFVATALQMINAITQPVFSSYDHRGSANETKLNETLSSFGSECGTTPKAMCKICLQSSHNKTYTYVWNVVYGLAHWDRDKTAAITNDTTLKNNSKYIRQTNQTRCNRLLYRKEW